MEVLFCIFELGFQVLCPFCGIVFDMICITFLRVNHETVIIEEIEDAIFINLLNDLKNMFVLKLNLNLKVQPRFSYFFLHPQSEILITNFVHNFSLGQVSVHLRSHV